MKNILKTAGICLSLALFLSFGSEAKAIAPTLTLENANDGDAIQLTVHGDPNYSVLFGYNKVGGEQILSSLGRTDANGNFSAPISTSYYGIIPSSIVRVTVNSQRSNELLWPVVAAGSQLILSETSIAMPLGQPKTITATGNGTNLLYLSNNSNPPVANVNISGNQIAIQPVNIGSSLVTVCANISKPICSSVYVNVQTGDAKPLVFSQGNVTIASGQVLGVSIIGGNGTYLVSNNSNQAAVQASISGSAVNLKALTNSGYAAVTVCSSDAKSCGVINVTAGDVSSTGLSFTQTSPSIQLGQTLSIGISGGASGSYSVFSNNYPSIVAASVTGSNLNLIGLANGSAIVTVCSGGNCGTVNATVNTLETGGSIRLNQNNLWLNVGQAQNITISGGSMPYTVLNDSTTTIKTVLTGNSLNVAGLNAGTVTVNVCSARGGCTPLSVLVNSVSSVTPTNNAGFTLTPNSTTLFVGNTQAVAISASGSYTVSGNSQPAVATAVLTDSSLMITALSQGSTNIYVCKTEGQCASVSVNVIMSSSNEPVEEVKPIATTTPIPVIDKPIVVKPVVVRFKFLKQLQVGSVGLDVKELQKRLQAEKLYVGKILGKFDQNTRNAVKKYQKLKKISQTGNLGPQTMKALNK
jgi:ferredoxin